MKTNIIFINIFNKYALEKAQKPELITKYIALILDATLFRVGINMFPCEIGANHVVCDKVVGFCLSSYVARQLIHRFVC